MGKTALEGKLAQCVSWDHTLGELRFPDNTLSFVLETQLIGARSLHPGEWVFIYEDTAVEVFPLGLGEIGEFIGEHLCEAERLIDGGKSFPRAERLLGGVAELCEALPSKQAELLKDTVVESLWERLETAELKEKRIIAEEVRKLLTELRRIRESATLEAGWRAQNAPTVAEKITAIKKLLRQLGPGYQPFRDELESLRQEFRLIILESKMP